MKKIVYLNADFGPTEKANVVLYEANPKSRSYLVMLPGVSEVGSNLALPEAVDWYAKYAANGTLEADFNIVTIQPPDSQGYSDIAPYLYDKIVELFNPAKIVLLGIDLGARTCLLSAYYNTSAALSAIIAYSTVGAPTGTINGKSLSQAVDVPIRVEHQASDATSLFSTVQTYVDAVNAAIRINSVSLITQMGSGHNSWSPDLTANKNLPMYQMIMTLLSASAEYVRGWEAAKERVSKI